MPSHYCTTNNALMARGVLKCTFSCCWGFPLAIWAHTCIWFIKEWQDGHLFAYKSLSVHFTYQNWKIYCTYTYTPLYHHLRLNAPCARIARISIHKIKVFTTCTEDVHSRYVHNNWALYLKRRTFWHIIVWTTYLLLNKNW